MPVDYKNAAGYTLLGIGVLMAYQHFAFADDVTIEDIAAPSFSFSATNTASLSASSVFHLSVADPTTGQEYEAWLERYAPVQITEVFSG
jgi:hypothetical protein